MSCGGGVPVAMQVNKVLSELACLSIIHAIVLAIKI